jgi:hypothetical protein
MAAQDAQDGERRSPQHAMLLYCFICVLRTAGKETARRRQTGRNDRAVAAQGPKQDGLHAAPRRGMRENVARKSSQSALKAASRTDCRAMTIMSTAFPGRPTVSSAARTRRRTRLRSTADRKPLAGTIPTRGRPRRDGVATIATCRPSSRLPRRRTRANSASPESLSYPCTPGASAFRVPGACGLSCGARR